MLASRFDRISQGTEIAALRAHNRKRRARMFKLHSPAFAPDAAIPDAYTAPDRSPPLTWSGAPSETKSYALIMHDPDAASGDFAHWAVYNMPATRTELPEDSPHTGDFTDGTQQGRNDFERVGYGGPNPPAGERHRYRFELFALDDTIPLEPGAGREAITRAMQGHILARAELTGRYRN
jgi:Raf kinase inhibitor-like YbhB/YbcL family protein